jgi:hypothetical protein
MAWAKQKAAEVEEEILEFRACGLCHKVLRDPESPSGWRIPDVQISQRWFSKGIFDHASHENAECKDCHEAALSQKSEDVILPDIRICRDCHGGEHSSGKLDSSCVSCHLFHTPDQLLLGQRGLSEPPMDDMNDAVVEKQATGDQSIEDQFMEAPMDEEVALEDTDVVDDVVEDQLIEAPVLEDQGVAVPVIKNRIRDQVRERTRQ